MGFKVNSNLFGNFYSINQKGIRLEKQAINNRNKPIKKITDVERLNDIGFRLILIPAFGVMIPLLTGMVHELNFHDHRIKLSFLFSIGHAYIIWQGNRYLLFTLRSYFDWFNKPVRKLVILVLAVMFYTIPISALLLVMWYKIFNAGIINWNQLATATLAIMVCVLFVTHIYETVFLVREAEKEKLKKEQLERARAEAELEALKNQIDPHFIFNSLNTLSHLIEKDPAKARKFNDNLADVYRYILQNKARALVFLREEMLFLNDYFYLLKIRFEKAVQLDIQIDAALYEQYLIPPISLQILVENAIKHNEFSDAVPLVITISMQADELIIHNQVRKKALRKASSRVGLNNLGERYKLTTSKEISIQESADDFTVSLPILKIA